MGVFIIQFNVNVWMDFDCKFYDFCFVVVIYVVFFNFYIKVYVIYKLFMIRCMVNLLLDIIL